MPKRQNRSSGNNAKRRINPTIIAAVIGVIGTIAAALIASPFLKEWFTPENEDNHFSPADFVERMYYRDIEQLEFQLKPDEPQPSAIADFIKLSQAVYDPRIDVIRVDLAVRNVRDEDIMLDLHERYFGLEDNRGKEARLISFQAPSRGTVLPVGDARDIELFFHVPGWQAKSGGADLFYFRIEGLLPIVRASWKWPAIKPEE